MRRHLVWFALAAAAIGFARDAGAQGFQVNEHGTCAMARGGAGVANETLWSEVAILGVPEPGSLSLVALGALGMLATARRKRG